MLKRWLIVLVALLLIPAVLAEVKLVEGYTRTEGIEGTYTIYNGEDIKEIFGIEPYEMAGVLSISYKYAGRERVFGQVTGSVFAFTETKRVKITDGTFIPPPGSKVNVSMSGTTIGIDASKLGSFAFEIEEGRYTENEYTFLCRSEDCKMSALVMPTDAYLNITGNALVIHNSVLDDYLKGKAVSSDRFANFSDLSEIRVMEGKELTLYTRPSGLSLFDAVKVKSEHKILLKKILDWEYCSVKANTAEIHYLDQDTPLHLISTNTKANVDGLHLLIDEQEIMEMVRGSLYVYTQQTDYEYVDCAGKKRSVNKEFFEKASCAYINNIAGTLEYKPKITDVKIGKKTVKMPLTLKLKDPKFSLYTNLTVEGFAVSDAKGSLSVEMPENQRKRMLFNRDRVFVTDGNWFDFGVSFVTYLYDKNSGIYNRFECDANTKECFLNHVKVSGFEKQKLVRCNDDSDCGEGMKCDTELERCVRKTACNEVKELSPAAGLDKTIDVVFISDGYESQEDFMNDIKTVVDREGYGKGLFSIEPFKSNRDKFRFWSVDGSAMPYSLYVGGESYVPSESYAEAISQECTNADQRIILSKKPFTSHAYLGDGMALISMPDVYENGAAVFVHEFGHSFGGLADEYYTKKAGIRGTADPPNCLASYTQAKNLWGQETADEAKDNWRGCGGTCDERCSTYYRPSENSIMRHHTRAHYFNDVSKEWMEKKLGRFGILETAFKFESLDLNPKEACGEHNDCEFKEDKSVLGGENSKEYLVIHITEGGSAEETEQLLRTGMLGGKFYPDRRKLSVHYILARDGSIIQQVDEDKIAMHVGPGWNSRAIGIEIANSGSTCDEKCVRSDACSPDDCTIVPGYRKRWEQFPEEQLRALVKLASEIAIRNNIPVENIVPHGLGDVRWDSCAPKGLTARKHDPGPLFPWCRFLASVKGEIGVAEGLAI